MVDYNQFYPPVKPLSPRRRSRSRSRSRSTKPRRSNSLGKGSDHEKRRTQKVSFADEHAVSVHQCGPISREEKDAMWYTKRDFEMFEKNDKKVKSEFKKWYKVAREYVLDNDQFWIRGLEDDLSRESSLKAKQRKTAVLQAVLTEQIKQREMGINDPVQIRRKSILASKESKLLARNLGEADRRFAREAWLKSAQGRRPGSERKLKVESRMLPSTNRGRNMRRSASLSTGLKIDRETKTICVL